MVRLTNGKDRQLLLVMALAVVVATGGWLWVRQLRNPGAQPAAGVECINPSQQEIISFFYKPGTPSATLRQLALQIGGKIQESYPATDGTSLSIPVSQYRSGLRIIRRQAYVLSASASADQSCQDPD